MNVTTNKPKPTQKTGTKTYENRYDSAEVLKSLEYQRYYTGNTLEERVNGLRNVMRCHFIKEFCLHLIHGVFPKKYNDFKENWKIKEINNFEKEIVQCL